jgi:hypothetical protein
MLMAMVFSILKTLSLPMAFLGAHSWHGGKQGAPTDLRSIPNDGNGASTTNGWVDMGFATPSPGGTIANPVNW